MSPVNECIPYFDDGDDLTGHTTAPVVGKTFAGISADVPGGMDGTENMRVATCPAGGRAIGVFAYDAVTDAEVAIKAGPGFILPVTAGGAIAAGDLISVGANGKAVTAPSAVAARLTTGVVGNNNAILFTANAVGVGGNAIRVQLVDPRGNSRALSVDVNGSDIVVNLATDSGGAITSTAALIIAAINAQDTASQLVTAANAIGSSGAGVVVAAADTALSGGSDAPKSIDIVAMAVASAISGADCPIRLFT